MAWVEYTPRILASVDILRDRDTPLELGMYHGGNLIAPSSGTISIYDDSNTAVVSAEAVTVSGSLATYTVQSADVSSKAYAAGWRVEWALTMPDGNVHDVKVDAALVRSRLHPVITDADLLRRHTDLSSLRPPTESSYQDYIDEAWTEIRATLEASGRRPALILSPQALRTAHLYLTLSLIFRDFGGTGDPENKWARLADHYHAQYREAWAALNFVYDETNSGQGSARRRTAATGGVWLMSRGGYGSGDYRWPR